LSEDSGPIPPAHKTQRAAQGLAKNGPIFASYKMPEFFDKSPLSGAEKHPDFQVTSCHQNVTTDVKFDD
jgi:hypothetical protein